MGNLEVCTRTRSTGAHRPCTLWADMEMELEKCFTLIDCDLESFLLLSIPILHEMMDRLARWKKKMGNTHLVSIPRG